MSQRGRASRSSIAVLVVIAVGAVAGILVTSAALTDDENTRTTSTSTSTSASRRTTTTRAREFPAGQEWTIATALVAPPPTTTTTAATSTLTTVPGPPPATPPAPGQYAYSETTDGETTERVYRIEDRPPAEGEQRVEGELQFLVTLETAGGRVTTITSWRQDSVLAVQTIFRMPDTETSCDWDPDLLQLMRPLVTEGSWSYATGCLADFGGNQVRIDRSGEVQVETDERITVAGEEVTVWRLESKETTRFTGAIERVDQEIRTWWFAPKYGLTVKESSAQRHTTPDGTSEDMVERELVALRPL